MLNTFVDKLLSILECETDVIGTAIESKIHSSNILRALFRNKDLDEQMSCFVERALMLAVQGIQSSFWNVRKSIQKGAMYNILIIHSIYLKSNYQKRREGTHIFEAGNF